MSHHKALGSDLFFRRLTEMILRQRLPCLIALGLVTLWLGSGLTSIKVDNSKRQWFQASDPSIIRYQQFQKDFGHDNFIFIMLETPPGHALSPQSLQLLVQLEESLKRATFHGDEMFEGVTHLGNIQYIEGDAAGIEVIDLSDGVVPSGPDNDLFKERALSNPQYEGVLFSQNQDALDILLDLRPMRRDDTYYHAIVDHLDATFKTEPFAQHVFHVGGAPVIDSAMDRLTISEARLFSGFAILLNFFICLFLFRRWSGVVITMLTVALTLIWTLGLIGIGGQSLGVVHVMLPMMLLVVGVSDSVHILSEYQREYIQRGDRREAIFATMGEVTLPCLLTSLTTAAGMSSLALAPIPPIRTMGIYAAIGVLLAFLISIVLVPIMLSYVGLEPKHQKPSDQFAKSLARVGSFSTRHAPRVLGLTALLIGLSLWGASRIRVESNFLETFRKSSDVRRAAHRIDATLGGTSTFQVLIDSGTDGGVKEPLFLTRLENFQTYIDSMDGVIKTLSIVGLVKELNEILQEGGKEHYRLPPSRNMVAQQLLLYENADPDGLFELITDDYRIARITVRTERLGTGRGARMMTQAEEKFNALFAPNSTLSFTGGFELFVRMTENLSRSQIRSYGAAFILVFLMMVMVLKNFWLGFLSMLPNIFPVLSALGLMGALDIQLDFITLLIACIAIGIAVDDTIHFLVRVKKEFQKTGSYEEASQKTLQSAGRAMLFTTLILCGGFLIFLPSEMLSIALFGGLVAFTVVMALLSDFIIMPALLAVTKPLGPDAKLLKP